MVAERGRWAYPPPTSTVLILTSLPRPPSPRRPPAEPPAAVPSDAALIAAWQGGDEQAAAELVRRHARAVARFLGAGLSGGTGDADVDDLVQETFIRAFRALGRVRGQGRFRTWLMTNGGNVRKEAVPRGQTDEVGGNARHGQPPARRGHHAVT